ncbi:type IV toxin-antitoxin system AbiEi family antitoxin domain-containing protein [Paenibacillus sp. SGZ-1009]|uniref:type IV toxin-antitoxin system AbiEi family antitoxin domain-containing protein n=1 Tax=Paenibacillus campi TaxID=3106031 RepID=UPI002B0032BF|nr:type IV toxin-antitoxin system AbiEi family antitoxin domain-containing protein [Paenibacillus sp. SGZ-1009]
MDDIILKQIKESFEQSGLTEESFFEIIRQNPNINSMDDFILAIKEQYKLVDLNNNYKNNSDIQQLFKEHNGIIDSASLREKGFSYYQLNKLEKMGIITKVKRGLYALSDVKKELHDMVEAALYVPRGVLCLYSALAHHELSTFTPSEYNFAISRKESKPSLPIYPPIRLHYFDNYTFGIGIEKFSISGHSVKVYDLERTICDVVKFRNKLDTNIVKESLKQYFTHRKVNYGKLIQYAEKMRVKSILNNYLEVL